MARNSVQGLAETYALFGVLADAARDEMALELAAIGGELLDAQQADVARKTGALASALKKQVLTDRLKVKVGLLSGAREARKFNGRQRKAVAGGPYYGRMVEGGRSAQTVLVTRRIKKRRVEGNGRNTKRRVIYDTAKKRLRRSSSPNAGTYIGGAYKLRVKAKAARPFVAQPLFQQVAENHLSEFWAKLLARTGVST